MRRFADLYDAIDATTSTNAKVEAMVRYLREAPPSEAGWAVFLLMGNRLKRLLSPRLAAEWALEESGVPSWLFEESYGAVGDIAETVALLLDRGVGDPEQDLPLDGWIARLLELKGLDPAEQRARVTGWWRALPRRELYLLIKLLTGELRVGVSQTLVLRAIAELTGLPREVISHRVMGGWQPSAEAFTALVSPDAAALDVSRPYPFFLAHPLDVAPDSLGPLGDWQAEWKWDGIRGQLIRRRGEVFLWSRGEELITERFPELKEAAQRLPDGTVLDGEVLAYADGRPLPFSTLQRRIGRQKLTETILREAPAGFMAYDLLEENGEDLRELPLADRRARLVRLLEGKDPRFTLSPTVEAADWAALEALRSESRARGVEGLMLKRLAAPYGVGRKKGDWWKWKIDPYSIDAVLIYAQPGNGRRSNILSDMTFAVWDADELVPVAKAYSGLSDEELVEADRWIRQNTIARFGPVRQVAPEQVFELHFEALAKSTRHRSGIAVRFPRIARWRKDKPAREADSVQTVRALLDAHAAR
jgi:DNA ligase-1